MFASAGFHMKNSFLQPFNSFNVNNLIYCFPQELKCFVEKTEDGKKKLSTILTIDLLICCFGMRRKKLVWCGGMIPCYVALYSPACALGESTSFCLLIPALPLHVVCGGDRDRNKEIFILHKKIGKSHGRGRFWRQY